MVMSSPLVQFLPRVGAFTLAEEHAIIRPELANAVLVDDDDGDSLDGLSAQARVSSHLPLMAAPVDGFSGECTTMVVPEPADDRAKINPRLWERRTS